MDSPDRMRNRRLRRSVVPAVLLWTLFSGPSGGRPIQDTGLTSASSASTRDVVVVTEGVPFTTYALLAGYERTRSVLPVAIGTFGETGRDIRRVRLAASAGRVSLWQCSTPDPADPDDSDGVRSVNIVVTSGFGTSQGGTGPRNIKTTKPKRKWLADQCPSQVLEVGGLICLAQVSITKLGGAQGEIFVSPCKVWIEVVVFCFEADRPFEQVCAGTAMKHVDCSATFATFDRIDCTDQRGNTVQQFDMLVGAAMGPLGDLPGCSSHPDPPCGCSDLVIVFDPAG